MDALMCKKKKEKKQQTFSLQRNSSDNQVKPLVSEEGSF